MIARSVIAIVLTGAVVLSTLELGCIADERRVEWPAGTAVVIDGGEPGLPVAFELEVSEPTPSAVLTR